MMIRPRAFVTSLLLALPAAAGIVFVVERVRAADREIAIERVVTSQVNAQVRERCESDPRWFLTGPLEGRPPRGEFVSADPDALAPRPKVNPQPFELFAYDEQFLGTSEAAPQFPREFRMALQASSDPVTAPYKNDAGTGVQVGVKTGWIGGPCMYFLGRLAPPPAQWSQRVRLFMGALGAVLLVSVLAALPTLIRVRRLARVAHESADAGYAAIAPEKLKDELSSMVFLFNDISKELQERKARIEDQDEALRRFVRATDEEIATPLAALAARLAAEDARLPATTGQASAAVDAQNLLAEVENLTAAARLRSTGAPLARTPLDLAALVKRVVARAAPLARAQGVSLDVALPSAPVQIAGDPPLIERAIGNVVDNAIRHNRLGGHTRVALERTGDTFTLRVTDDGPGLSEEAFKTLTAIRRFRGDEGRNRRPGAPGLGLAVAREVVDRFGLRLELRRLEPQGIEATVSGPVQS